MNKLNLPEAFVSRMKTRLDSDYPNFLESLQQAPVTSVRKNPFKPSGLFESSGKVPWAANAFYLDERISFTLDPLFHAGCYYVQEASSMYLQKVFEATRPEGSLKVLDLCASPGGKSTHLLSMLPQESLLISNEVISSRNKILRQNISKWGCSNVIVTQNDAADFGALQGFFDVVVIDAPCSGEGLFRKDPEAVTEWSESAVKHCAARQEEILENIIPCLRKDGILIYSTCTYEAAENDDIAGLLVNKHGFEPVEIDEQNDNITKTKYGLQFYPHKVKGEGFYIAAFRNTIENHKITLHVKEKKQVPNKNQLSHWIKNPGNFVSYLKERELYAIPEFIMNDFHGLMSRLFVRQAGIHAGTVMNNEIIPDHRLALSVDAADEIPGMQLDKETALRFLRCETIPPTDIPKGWYRAIFEGHALGWIKNLGTRTNNYFPKELRILMK